ncbi:MAG: hypothetical protein JXR37_23330 [Kiritimatiellae bacterium]|nr:hypothetical protein [Kiritimatiellia bacterium]
METIQRGNVTVHYSGDSRHIAERLVEITEKTYPVLKTYFNAAHDLKLVIYWADRQDWSAVPPNRHRTRYGGPHMTQGENHTHYVILPAANVDRPDSLVAVIAPLLDLTELTPDETRNLKVWLGLGADAGDRRLGDYLASSDFYVDLLVDIIHVHEVMHDFCYEFGIPENHSRAGKGIAWWVFEGLAQWSVLWVNREIGKEDWADAHDLLYRWMYRTGRKRPGNLGPLQYKDYAWFHGAVIEMAHQLEARYGKDYGPKVLTLILRDIQGKDYLPDTEMVKLFSEAAGEDLGAWFKQNWGIE